MSGNVVRLVNGGSIQVRTGVLQGIGPQGPTGPVGPAGPEGPQGPTGDVGPQGGILQVSSRATITSNTALTANTDTLIAFQTVIFDDSSAMTSSTNFTLHDIGDWMVNIGVIFSDPGSATGSRSIRLASVTNGDLLVDKRIPVTSDTTYCQLTYVHRSTVSNEVLNVYGRSTQALNATGGKIVITRVGSGPVGPAGPIGPAGPTGSTGATGPTGATGSGGHHTTYGDLHP